MMNPLMKTMTTLTMRTSFPSQEWMTKIEKKTLTMMRKIKIMRKMKMKKMLISRQAKKMQMSKKMKTQLMQMSKKTKIQLMRKMKMKMMMIRKPIHHKITKMGKAPMMPLEKWIQNMVPEITSITFGQDARAATATYTTLNEKGNQSIQ
jgi:hypothetical protein